MNLFRILSLLFLSSLPGLLSPFWRTDCHSLTGSKLHFPSSLVLVFPSSVSVRDLLLPNKSTIGSVQLFSLTSQVRPSTQRHQCHPQLGPFYSPPATSPSQSSSPPLGGTCHEPLTVPHQETKLPKPLVLIFSTVKNFIKIPDVFKRRAAIPHSDPRALHKLALVSLISCQLHIWAQTCTGQALTALGLLEQAGSGSGCTFPFLPHPLLRNA